MGRQDEFIKRIEKELESSGFNQDISELISYQKKSKK